jgi:predicted unusual protein kinase regulating ubiquinone biosynthesis (AarF/ABC1/UbiB family)
MSESLLAKRFELGRHTCAGVIGTVHASVETHTGEKVAIKVLRPDLAAAAELSIRLELSDALSHAYHLKRYDPAVWC